MIMPFVWLGVIVVAIIVEASTYALVSIWFVPAAIVSMILAFFKVDLWIQIVVFFVISILLLVFLRPVTTKLLKIKKVPTNSDTLIGAKVIVTEQVNNILETGAGKIQGKTWTIKSTDDTINFEVGDIVIVKEIQGVKLICEKENKEE